MVHLKRGLQRSRGIVRQLSVVVVNALAFSLGSCASKTPAINSASKQLQVVTTFIPITDFTKAVAGDYPGDRLRQRAQVTQLLPTNVGPHDFHAKPNDAEKLVKADVLIENGLGMEEFLDDLVKNAGNANLKIIDSSKGVQTISTAAFEGKKQDKAKQIELNPHIWLDPKRAIHQGVTSSALTGSLSRVQIKQESEYRIQNSEYSTHKGIEF